MPESHLPRLVLVRGHPGAGKTTLAEALVREADFVHHENDGYFTSSGIYVFDPARHGEAKAWCLSLTRQTLEQGRDVVVSNTFTTLLELSPYLSLGYPTTVVEMHLDFPNTHDVPAEVVSAKRAAFEPRAGAVSVRDDASALALVGLFSDRPSSSLRQTGSPAPGLSRR